MSARILDGKAPAALVFERVRQTVAAMKQPPGLAVIQVGEDPSSTVYVNMKEKRCATCGIRSFVYRLPETASEPELLQLIARLNADDAVDGILVQAPLPVQIRADRIVEAIAPDKDADCFHPANVGRLAAGRATVLPPTPAGALEILAHHGIAVAGKRVVVVGRSDIVGKPLGLMLLGADATPTWAHSRTANLAAVTREAEILFVAIGRPEFIGPALVAPGAVVVDIGINRVERGGQSLLVGDVDFAAVAKVASWVTPVPGGVGAMTIAMLLSNCVALAEARRG